MKARTNSLLWRGVYLIDGKHKWYLYGKPKEKEGILSYISCPTKGSIEDRYHPVSNKLLKMLRERLADKDEKLKTEGERVDYIEITLTEEEELLFLTIMIWREGMKVIRFHLDSNILHPDINELAIVDTEAKMVERISFFKEKINEMLDKIPEKSRTEETIEVVMFLTAEDEKKAEENCMCDDDFDPNTRSKDKKVF